MTSFLLIPAVVSSNCLLMYLSRLYKGKACDGTLKACRGLYSYFVADPFTICKRALEQAAKTQALRICLDGTKFGVMKKVVCEAEAVCGKVATDSLLKTLMPMNHYFVTVLPQTTVGANG